LKEIAVQEGMPVSQLVNRIDGDRDHGNLSSRLRVYVLEHYRRIAEEHAQRKVRSVYER
jgi:predicted DNA-binding ribbon-helix-helix protein